MTPGMGRAPVLVVWVLVLAAPALVGCGSKSDPEASRCARIWNEEPPADLSEGFDDAIAYR